MGKKVFISYSHQQGEWVWNALVPCLKAGGAEVLIDRERFEAGQDLFKQMDSAQDQADSNVLVFSPEYLASKSCEHEMKRAIKRDPKFMKGNVIPVLRIDCTLPGVIKRPLYVDLRDDKDAAQWDKLLSKCGANLGASAPDWLAARNAIVRYLNRGESVNLVVFNKPRWLELVKHIQKDYFPDLGLVDLNDGATDSRRGLITEMLKACGATTQVPPKPDDLVTLSRLISNRPNAARLALLRFDMVTQHEDYKNDVALFAALRDLITEKRKLILLVHSRLPFIEFLPKDHPLSSITDLKTVELHGRP